MFGIFKKTKEQQERLDFLENLIMKLANNQYEIAQILANLSKVHLDTLGVINGDIDNHKKDTTNEKSNTNKTIN